MTKLTHRLPREAGLPYDFPKTIDQKYGFYGEYGKAEILVAHFNSYFPDIYGLETIPGHISDVLCKNIKIYASQENHPMLCIEGGDGTKPEYGGEDIPMSGGPTERVIFENIVINEKKTD